MDVEACLGAGGDDTQTVLTDYKPHEVRDTSRESFRVLIGTRGLSVRYNEYLEQLEDLGRPSTDWEVTFHAGRADPNYFRPRRNELVKLGYIQDTGVRTCNVTGKMAHVWWFADEM